jgi:ectoine hydroxylase-related dioxygenase (phytanoyl-CoA dioxygenase family)
MSNAPVSAPSDTRVRYERDGFPIARHVFGPDRIAALAADAERLRQRTDLIDTNNIRCRWQDDAVTGECRFDCFDLVIDLSDACAGAARDPALLALVADAYGEPGCLFKNKLIFKSPGTQGYKLHQDYIGWPSFPTSFMTVIVAIDRADAQSGATEVFPGYHQQGCMTEADGTVPPSARRCRRSRPRRDPRSRARRRRPVQRIFAAPLGVERIDTLAAAALSELQPPERRRRAARGRDLLPLMPCSH